MAFALPLVGALAVGGGAAAAGGSLATALSVGSSALTGLSGFSQAQYQSAVAKQNAKIAADNAAQASQAAQLEQLRSDRQYAAENATVLAMQAASGLDVLGKSQYMTRENLSRVRGEAAQDIRQKGVSEVNRLFQQMANFQTEAKAQKSQSYMALTSGVLGIGSAVSKDKNLSSLIGGSRSTR